MVTETKKKTYITGCVVGVDKETLHVRPDRSEGPAGDIFCLCGILQVEAKILTNRVNPSPELSNNSQSVVQR
jgi:hypothetical protein